VQKMTLAGTVYSVECIGGLDFLIPYRMRPIEQSIRTNIKKIIKKLKTTGWYNYVLAADMLIVIMPSPRNEQFALVRTSNQSAHRPVFFINSGGLINFGISWNASVFVHEATHVFQKYYLSGMSLKKLRRQEENDASRMQILFLKRCGCVGMARYLKNQLKKTRGWWEWLDSGPTNEEEHRDADLNEHCSLILAELMPYILI